MEQEKKELQDIEIIDEGMGTEDGIGPEMMCCWGAYSPTFA